MIYKYRAFGIPIYSEIVLGALMPYQGMEEGIKVLVGTVPEELIQPALVKSTRSSINQSELLLLIPAIGKFYIQSGQSIVIEPLCADMDTVLIYFYTNALAAALLQRQLLIFHVSGVVDHDGKVILIAGHSGAGKSTMATLLHQKGYSLFTDDTAVLSLRNGKCFAVPSYPMVRLWETSIAVQRTFKRSEGVKLRSTSEQDKMGFTYHEDFRDEGREVKKVICLRVGSTGVERRVTEAVDGLVILSRLLYRESWLRAMNMQSLAFFFISEMILKIPVVEVSRPMAQDSYQEVLAEFEKVINAGV